MYRDSLRQSLIHYDSCHPEQESVARTMLDFLDSHTDCFERSQSSGHFTASAWVVDSSESRVLLLHHRKLDKWLQPGGHADGDPDLLGVAMRETYEECGLKDLIALNPLPFDLDIHEFPERNGAPAHLHYDVRFALKSTTGQLPKGNDESLAVSWIPLHQLTDYTTEHSILRMRDKWIAHAS